MLIAFGPIEALAAKPPARPWLAPWYTYQLSLIWLNAAAYTSVREDPLNPGNAVAMIPELKGQSELKPNLKLEAGAFRAIMRPRLRYLPSRIVSLGQGSRDIRKTELLWSEANLQWTASDALSVTYGLQNFQWGPAESFSPSNRIFPETAQWKNVLYETRGKHLARVNLSAGRDWSAVLMAELSSNGEAELLAEEPFRAKGLMKLEYSWGSGADYAGLVGGLVRGRGAWIGEYGNLTLSDFVSLYFDASHERGSAAWYPEGTGFAQSRLEDRAILSRVASGFRLSLESGVDLRFEYVYHGPGYSRAQQELARTALALNPLSAGRFFASGLDLSGVHFAYFSGRYPDFLGARSLTLYNRYMLSLVDRSGAAYASGEYDVGSSGTVFLAGGATHGGPGSELGRLVAGVVIGGYRHAW